MSKSQLYAVPDGNSHPHWSCIWKFYYFFHSRNHFFFLISTPIQETYILQARRKHPFGFAKPKTSMVQHSNTTLVGVNFSSYWHQRLEVSCIFYWLTVLLPIRVNLDCSLFLKTTFDSKQGKKKHKLKHIDLKNTSLFTTVGFGHKEYKNKILLSVLQFYLQVPIQIFLPFQSCFFSLFFLITAKTENFVILFL